MGCRPSSPEVITVTPPDPPSSEIPNDPPPPKSRSYRPSIASLQIPIQDDLSTECLRLGTFGVEKESALMILLSMFLIVTFSDQSTDQEVQENQDYLCGTEVSLQWLLQTLSDRFNRQFDEEPQWIVERLNRPKWDDYATSTVLRVTFGWEEDDLPKNVILKTPTAKDLRDDEKAKYHYLMFKRECNVYDWTQKYPKIPAPRIFHTKRHTKEYGGVVVMEDIGERGVQQDAIKGLSVDTVRDLLRQLAVLHNISIKQIGWNTTVADLPPSYYSYLVSGYNDIVDFFVRNDVNHSCFTATSKYFTSEYLQKMSTEMSEQLPPKVFIHGEPYASNVFVVADSKEPRIAAIIDWTGTFYGCFEKEDRLECTTSLLEDYHVQLVENLPDDCQITLEAVRKAFDLFVPVAMVTFLSKVMASKNNTEDIEPLIDRGKGLIQNVYTMTKILEE
ncbi:hypothetical protein DICVIV_08811 [Dictyocaulus viviparus]|uniref:CHK kinase-like domain-containing protein n=1 Tax=Dictyocaulus viviparus TaxID=29172 RepID=A0A0D8XKS2_DICVI|nr:hypothetical protein DICVIV_08811 [Dictyocaulus viviparus]